MSNVTKNEVVSKITAVMLRVGRTGCSASDGYIVCGMNMPLWEIVRDLGVESNLWVVTKSHWMTLTPSGLVMVNEAIAELESAQSAQSVQSE